MGIAQILIATLEIIFVIICIGAVGWAIKKFIPLEDFIKNIIIFAVVILLLIAVIIYITSYGFIGFGHHVR